MVSKVLESYASIGDLLVSHFDPAYCFEGRKIANASGSDQTITTIGIPVKTSGDDWVAVLATDEANTEGLLIETRSINVADGEKSQSKMNVLVRGPAVVDISAFPDKDPAGTAYTKATIKTALEALSPPVIVLDDSDRSVISDVQSTA